MRCCAACTWTGSSCFEDAAAGLQDQITARAAPWQRELDLLKTLPGFGNTVAQAWLAEIGPAPHLHFSSQEKLASWVSLCPGNNISARKRKHGRTGEAGTYIKPMLVQGAWSAVRFRGWLQARYNRLVRRFGGDKNPGAKKKAITAIAHTLLKIAYQVLKSGTPYQDLGADFYTRRESPAPAAGIPGTPAAKAPSRLHHYRHHQPPGGSLNTRRLTPSTDSRQPRSRRPTRPPPSPAGQTSATIQPQLHSYRPGSLPRAQRDTDLLARSASLVALMIGLASAVISSRPLPSGQLVSAAQAPGEWSA